MLCDYDVGTPFVSPIVASLLGPRWYASDVPTQASATHGIVTNVRLRRSHRWLASAQPSQEKYVKLLSAASLRLIFFAQLK